MIDTPIIDKEVFIIAEVGNNHLGDLEIASDSLAAAAEAGVDAVKFQMIDADEVIRDEEPVYGHVPDNRFKAQKDRWQALKISESGFRRLAEEAKALNVSFMCTAFDFRSCDFIDPLVDAHKIASCDANHTAYIEHVLKKGKKTFISTGFCKQNEVARLAKKIEKWDVVLMHCISSYPTSIDESKVGLIQYYQECFNSSIGYSDHTAGYLAAVAAVVLGAVAVEKHFILDKKLPGGDRALSLCPSELADMVKGIRDVSKMRGTLPRTIEGREKVFGSRLRRAPYAKCNLKGGQQFSVYDLKFLRPPVENAFDIEVLSVDSTLVATKEIRAGDLISEQNTRVQNSVG